MKPSDSEGKQAWRVSISEGKKLEGGNSPEGKQAWRVSISEGEKLEGRNNSEGKRLLSANNSKGQKCRRRVIAWRGKNLRKVLAGETSLKTDRIRMLNELMQAGMLASCFLQG
ncbi:MAG: hypothetical protein VKO44_11430 [Cyanobacteriota bacterium]|nr:hypothetical protein [Cyanobacteriota bacterium]